MDTQQTADKLVSVTDAPHGMVHDNSSRSIDPLKRVWVPVERRTTAGTWVFRTTDGELYCRAEDGSMRRVNRKTKGKSARKADRVHRRLLRRAAQKAAK